MTLGEIIKEYRQSHGLSQDSIADASGLSKAYISILERNRNPKTGEPPVASLKTIKAISRAIGSDFDTVFSKLNPDIKISLSEQLPPSTVPESEDAPAIENPDIRMIARAGRKMTPEQAENVRKYAEFMFPEAFKDDDT